MVFRGWGASAYVYLRKAQQEHDLRLGGGPELARTARKTVLLLVRGKVAKRSKKKQDHFFGNRAGPCDSKGSFFHRRSAGWIKQKRKDQATL